MPVSCKYGTWAWSLLCIQMTQHLAVYTTSRKLRYTILLDTSVYHKKAFDFFFCWLATYSSVNLIVHYRPRADWRFVFVSSQPKQFQAQLVFCSLFIGKRCWVELTPKRFSGIGIVKKCQLFSLQHCSSIFCTNTEFVFWCFSYYTEKA